MALILETKHLYIVRHGETDYNRQGIVQGAGVDAPLNETGRQQAMAFFEQYRDLGFDKIYASELSRAIQTVEPFKTSGVPLEKHPGLNEINWGYYEGQKVWHYHTNYYGELLNRWRNGQTHIPIHGGESPNDVALRQQEVIDLLQERSEEKQVLICMHGRAMRIFLCQLLGKPLSEMDAFRHNNLGLYKVVWKNGDAVELELANHTEHLSAKQPEDA